MTKFIHENYTKGFDMHIESSYGTNLNIYRNHAGELHFSLYETEPNDPNSSTYFKGVELVGIQEMLKDLVPLVDELVAEYQAKQK